jgi:hypothetical protein
MGQVTGMCNVYVPPPKEILINKILVKRKELWKNIKILLKGQLYYLKEKGR